jgi:hypothetical protein
MEIKSGSLDPDPDLFFVNTGPGVSLVDLFCFVRVIALDLIKICNFQHVSHVAQKVFDLGS